MWRDRRPITFGGDYIIGAYHRDFYKVCIREPRVLTYHQMILTLRKGGVERKNRKYFKGRTTCPFAAPNRGPMLEEDAILEDLQS